jgi:hypothetical protein
MRATARELNIRGKERNWRLPRFLAKYFSCFLNAVLNIAEMHKGHGERGFEFQKMNVPLNYGHLFRCCDDLVWTFPPIIFNILASFPKFCAQSNNGK